MPDIKRSTIVPYTAAQMFALVDKIEDYPQFVPWCKSTEVLTRSDDEVHATLHFARGAIEKSFTTLNRLQKNKMIEIRLIKGPFHHMEGMWLFEPLDEKSSQVKLDLEFEFSSRLLGFALEPFFTQMTTMLVDVFRKRAEEIYGK